MLKRCVVAATAVVLIVGTAAAQSVSDAACRLSVGNSVRLFGEVIAVQVGICHRQRLRGALPSSIDCNQPSTWMASGYAHGATGVARGVVRFRAAMQACSPGPVTPADVGYTSCPAPCAGLPVTSFDELGACLQCVTEPAVLVALQAGFGTPPLPLPKPPRVCQLTVGRLIVRYFNKRALLQDGCQFRKEAGQTDYVAADCEAIETAPPAYADRIVRARQKLTRSIAARCGEVNLATDLDSCGADVSGETSCITAAVDQCTATLFAAIYPPH